MTEQKKKDHKELQIQIAPDVDYVYRNLINIHVGTSEVIIEFGNQHRSQPGQATIANRIVLSIPNAFNLAKSLQQALQTAEEQVRQNLQARREKKTT